MLIMINQNILTILRLFLNLKKKIMKNCTPTKLPQVLLLNFLANFFRKKISNEHFNLCEAEIYLDVS